MNSILIAVLINGLGGYFLVRWQWKQGFRRGYMAGCTDSQNAFAEALGRLLKKPPDG